MLSRDNHKNITKITTKNTTSNLTQLLTPPKSKVSLKNKANTYNIANSNPANETSSEESTSAREEIQSATSRDSSPDVVEQGKKNFIECEKEFFSDPSVNDILVEVQKQFNQLETKEILFDPEARSVKHVIIEDIKFLSMLREMNNGEFNYFIMQYGNDLPPSMQYIAKLELSDRNKTLIYDTAHSAHLNLNSKRNRNIIAKGKFPKTVSSYQATPLSLTDLSKHVISLALCVGSKEALSPDMAAHYVDLYLNLNVGKVQINLSEYDDLRVEHEEFRLSQVAEEKHNEWIKQWNEAWSAYMQNNKDNVKYSNVNQGKRIEVLTHQQLIETPAFKRAAQIYYQLVLPSKHEVQIFYQQDSKKKFNYQTAVIESTLNYLKRQCEKEMNLTPSPRNVSSPTSSNSSQDDYVIPHLSQLALDLLEDHATNDNKSQKAKAKTIAQLLVMYNEEKKDYEKKYKKDKKDNTRLSQNPNTLSNQRNAKKSSPPLEAEIGDLNKISYTKSI